MPGDSSPDKQAEACHRFRMTDKPKRCRLSEVRRLPRFRCEHCGSKMHPDYDGVVGDPDPDPVVAVTFNCSTFLCNNNGSRMV